MLGKVFDRFVEKSPISVMVRGTLERVLGADQLDAWFSRTAQKQYTRTVLLSTVYDILSQVVFRITPSVRAAYRDHTDQVGASLISLYNKLNGVETHTSAELVRYSAAALRPLIAQLDGPRAPWLPGYRVKILDGNCIEASERRLKVLREVQAGALPGKSLVVYEPAQGLVSDVFPCEDGHAQERSLLGLVLETVQTNDLWMQDRNFCPCAFLCEMDRRGAGFITRQHEGLPFEVVNTLRSVGRIETGHVAEQRVQVWDAQGDVHLFRRIRVKLDGDPPGVQHDAKMAIGCCTSSPSFPCARPRPNGWHDYIASAGRWRPRANISKRTFIRQSIRWGLPRRPCSAVAWPWSPTICWRWCWRRCAAYMVPRALTRISPSTMSPTIAPKPITA